MIARFYIAIIIIVVVIIIMIVIIIIIIIIYHYSFDLVRSTLSLKSDWTLQENPPVSRWVLLNRPRTLQLGLILQ